MRTTVAGAGHLVALLLATTLLAEEPPAPPSVRVAGEVRFEKSAPIFLRLIALDEAKTEVVAREQIIELTTEDVSRATVHFEFVGLTPGRYALKCFQDTNGNKRLDIGVFGPKEPWATYRLARPKLRPPRFEEMAFNVAEDVTNAHLILR